MVLLSQIGEGINHDQLGRERDGIRVLGLYILLYKNRSIESYGLV